MKLLWIILGLGIATSVVGETYFANGIKIGEVDQDSAIVWTRLTRNPAIDLDGTKFKKVSSKVPVPAEMQLPDGKTLDDMVGAVPGAPGEVRLTWQAKGETPVIGDWCRVEAASDYTYRFSLNDLQPATEYKLKVENRDGVSASGHFKTAPPKDMVAPITFSVITCQKFSSIDDPVNGLKIYHNMLNLQPDFFVHTGDLEYYDQPAPLATNPAFARFKMTRMFGLPYIVSFVSNTAGYFMKDDHDMLKDDCWPGATYGDLTWDQGLQILHEQFPLSKIPYRTFRWGKDLQIWLVEGREFRSPNKMPDGPDKSIWGAEQKAWFFRTVKASDATFKVLISPTPIVGPDRKNKNDNLANVGFQHEGDEIRKFIASQKNMYVACGDRHWQYVSVDSKTGVKEFSCGPTSNARAGGWKNSMVFPEHRYLKVQGGFLTISIDRKNGTPVLTARHYDVDGKLCNEDVNTGI